MFRRRFMHLTGSRPCTTEPRAGRERKGDGASPDNPFGPASAAALAGAKYNQRKKANCGHNTRTCRFSGVRANRIRCAAPPPQRLWRFTLTGLGPLGLLCIFALLAAVSDHVG